MRERGLAAATLLAAFAIAHLMQFGLSAGRAITGEAEATPIGLATLVAWGAGGSPAALPPTPPTVPDPAFAALEPPHARLSPRDAAVPPILDAARQNGFGVPCTRTLTLHPLPGAIVEARVEAPCDAGVRVEMNHAGLRFAIATDVHGQAQAHIPALMTEALVQAAFSDGTRLSAHAAVPDAARVERVALVAEPRAGLTLHAGPAKSLYARTSSATANSDRTILRLGDPAVGAPLLAEVFTAPAGRFGPLGAAVLRVEATLSADNCARDVQADVIRSSGGLPVPPLDLRLSLPDCDAEGGVLVVHLPTSPALRVAGN